MRIFTQLIAIDKNLVKKNKELVGILGWRVVNTVRIAVKKRLNGKGEVN